MPNVSSEILEKQPFSTASVACGCCSKTASKKSIETPWQWRTEKPQNCTPKMPNVTSETHRKWWFWPLFPLAAAMNFGYLVLLLLQKLLLLLLVPGWENTVAVKDGEEKNNLFRQLLLPAAAAVKQLRKNHLLGGKHRASEGRASSKTTPKKCLTCRLKSYLFRQLLLPAAAGVKQLRKNHLPGENTVPLKDELVPKPRQKSA